MTTARSAMSSSIFWLYGRADRVASWARFSFDAATNCIARVICLMFFTAAMRRRISRWLATQRPSSGNMQLVHGIRADHARPLARPHTITHVREANLHRVERARRTFHEWSECRASCRVGRRRSHRDDLGKERFAEGGKRIVEALGDLVGERLGLAELLEDLRLFSLEKAVELVLEVLQPRRRDVVQLAGRCRIEDRDLLLDRERLVLRLLDDLAQLLAAGQLVAGRLVEIRRELGEGRQAAVLGQVQLERCRDLLHRLRLRRRSNSRHGDTDVEGGPLAGVEEVGLEEDLAVGDRDDVRRDVGRHVALLGLDDRQGRQGAAAVLVVHPGGPLEEPAVEVEDVARVGLAARWAAQQERHLAIGPGVLAEVVIDAQGVLDEALALELDAVLHDLLAHRYAGVRGEVLERGGILGAGDDDDRMVERAIGLEDCHRVRHGRQLLADRDVDADEALPLLVDDRVDRDGGLAGLAVADDELALAAADRDERVDRLDAGLDRRIDRLADDDAGGDPLDRAPCLRGDRALVVDRAAERVDDPTEERLADRHFDDATGRLDRVALLDRAGVAEDDRTDGLLLEVEGHAHHPARELEHLEGEGRVQAIDLGDPVADLDDGADAAGLDAGVERIDRRFDDAGDLVRANGHWLRLQSLAAAGREGGRVGGLDGPGGELSPQPLEAAPDAPVEKAVTDPHDDAAQQ